MEIGISILNPYKDRWNSSNEFTNFHVQKNQYLPESLQSKNCISPQFYKIDLIKFIFIITINQARDFIYCIPAN